MTGDVRDRPILFSGEMVRAILDGRKSQTRRVVKLPPFVSRKGGSLGDAWANGSMLAIPIPDDDVVMYLSCPYGTEGDPVCGEPASRLWVRETFCPVDDREYGGDQWTDYRATPRYGASHPAGWDAAPEDADALKWRPSIFMPRAASRLMLEITDVRVEALREITDADARAEGCAGGHDAIPGYGFSATPTEHYRHLWDVLNAKRGYGWNANPWVWALSFRVLSPQSAVAAPVVSAGGTR